MNMNVPVVLDTNVLLDNPNIIDQYDNIILPTAVLEELDGLKKSPDIGYSAREASRKIETNIDKIKFIIKDIYNNYPEGWDLTSRDNKIILSARDSNAIIISNDLNVRLKAQSIGLKSDVPNIDCDIPYKGYKEIIMTPEELSEHYTNPINRWNLLINEYLLIQDENGIIVDKQKWTEKGFVSINSKGFKSIYFGDIKPKDVYQMCAIDSLINNDFTLLTGGAGTAKTLLSLAWIMQNIQNNKISKAVIVFPVSELKNSKSLGYYPGSRIEKILSTSLGGILSSKLGDMMMVETLINQGKLMLIPTADIRGIEISSNDVLYVTEAQNTDSYTMRTILQRAAEGCKIIIEGDHVEQMDIRCNNKQNGMVRAIEVFKGKKQFSCVKLKNTYRSPISEIAQNI
jgi:predicted ribonuclease YlaK